MRAWPLLALLVVGLSGCGGHKAATHPTPYQRISWAEAKGLIRQCQAREVGQTHSRLVTIALRDGGHRYTREPEIDDVIGIVNQAMKNCGPITFATE
jgi:hypothetical protein